MGMSYVTQHPVTGKFRWTASCGASGDGFDTKKDAEVALRLHVVGCKDC